MLEITPRTNAKDVKDYYRAEERSQGVESSPPRWFGLGAIRLGLEGILDRLTFNKLVDNRMPFGKGKITERGGQERSIRLWDFTYGCPKSVTLAREFAPEGDKIQAAFVDAVLETMAEAVEPNASTRVRKGNAYEDRRTAEITGGLYVHRLNREGSPHMHGHADVLNHTWDQQEGKFKAVKVHDIFRKASDIQADFHRRLRGKVQALGYPTIDKGHFWEIATVPESAIKKFSERRQAIEQLYEKADKVTGALRQKAGLMTRKPKVEVVDLEQQHELWVSRLTDRELDAFKHLRAKPKVGRMPESLRKSKSRVAFLRQMGNVLRDGNERQRTYDRQR